MLRHEEKIQRFAAYLINHYPLPELLRILATEINRELAQGGPDQLGVSLRRNTLVAYLFKYLAFKFENHETDFTAFIFQNCGEQLQVYINQCWQLYIESPKTLGCMGGFTLDTVKEKFRTEVKLAQAIDLNPSETFPNIDITPERSTELENIIIQFYDPENPENIVQQLMDANNRLSQSIQNAHLRNQVIACLSKTIEQLMRLGYSNIDYSQKKTKCQTHLTVLREIMQSYVQSDVREVTSTQGFGILTQILAIEYQPAETKQTGWLSNIRWPRLFGNGTQTQSTQPSEPTVTTEPNPRPASDS